MSDGIYTINYTGQAGFGSAVVVFQKGQIFGVDVAGGEYTGTYHLAANGTTSGEINLKVPAGVSLVTGAPVSSQPYTVPIPFSLPSVIDEGQTVQTQVKLPTGAVNANVKKMKNLAA